MTKKQIGFRLSDKARSDLQSLKLSLELKSGVPTTQIAVLEYALDQQAKIELGKRPAQAKGETNRVNRN